MTDFYDLRTAFTLTCLYAPEPSSPPGDVAEPDPSPAAEPENDDSDDTAGEGDGEDDEQVDNPRLKKLSDEAAKWRNQFRQAEARIQELEDAYGAEELKAENLQLRLRLAFDRAVADFRDPDAAWKLAQDDLTTVNIEDDGTVDAARVGEIVAHVAKRYPYLVDEPAATEPSPAATRPSGRPVNGRRNANDDATTQRVLEGKFPALRRR